MSLTNEVRLERLHVYQGSAETCAYLSEDEIDHIAYLFFI